LVIYDQIVDLSTQRNAEKGKTEARESKKEKRLWEIKRAPIRSGSTDNKKALGWFSQVLWFLWSGRPRFARDDPLNPIFFGHGSVSTTGKAGGLISPKRAAILATLKGYPPLGITL
jgi:hypothetical protein